MKQIRVLLADDHSVVREGLRALLEIEGGFDVVGEAADGLQAVALAQELHPDVVVMDLAMPKLNGIEATRQLLLLAPPPRVLILSAHGDDAYVEQVAALGATGYLVKQTSAHRLARGIRDAYSGKFVCSPGIAKRLREEQENLSIQNTRYRKQPSRLTPREYQVLQLIAEGRANKQIAAELEVSIKTVEKHRQNLMQKLDIHDTASLTRYAISAGIIESNTQSTITKIGREASLR